MFSAPEQHTFADLVRSCPLLFNVSVYVSACLSVPSFFIMTHAPPTTVLSARLGCGKGGLSWGSEELLAQSLQVRVCCGCWVLDTNMYGCAFSVCFGGCWMFVCWMWLAA